MNSHSAKQLNSFKVRSLFIVISLIGFSSLGYARPQNADPPKLTLAPTQDGFKGVFTDNGKSYTIENRELKDEFRTRITRPDGSLLVESQREGGILNVVLPTGKLRMDISNPSTFSTEETRAIEEFTQSKDCALVKEIVLEVFRRRASERPSLVAGFRIISMFLGE
ncbi:MAG: hypothetical protein ACXWID_08610 [Pyrinomonadaceae bacterium]